MGSAVPVASGESFGSCVDRKEGRRDDAEFKIDDGDTAWESAATAEESPAAEALVSFRSRKSTSPR
jgi:hypothetical protein